LKKKKNKSIIKSISPLIAYATKWKPWEKKGKATSNKAIEKSKIMEYQQCHNICSGPQKITTTSSQELNPTLTLNNRLGLSK
jgi:hypothetical protein